MGCEYTRMEVKKMEIRYSRRKKKSGLIEIKTEGWEGIDQLSVDAMWQILWFDSLLSELLKRRVVKKVNTDKYILMVKELLNETYSTLEGFKREQRRRKEKSKTYVQ